MKFRSSSKLLQLNVLHVLNDGFLVSLPLLLPFLQNDMGLSLTQIGFLATALKSFEVILPFPASHIAEKLGSFRVLIFAMLLYALGYFITGFAPGIMIVAVGFLLAGVGFGVFHPIAFALVDTWSKPQNRGQNMGNFTAIGDIGRLGIASGVTVIAAIIGWRMTSILYGSVALLLFLGFLLILTRSKKVKPTDHHKSSKNSTTFSFIRARFLLINLTAMLDSLSSSALFIYIPFLLVFRGASVDLLGSLTAAFFVGNMFGKLFLGRLVDQLGNKRVLFMAEGCMALALIVMTQVPSIILIAGISIFLGAMTKGTVPVIMTMISESLQDGDSREKAYAFKATSTGIASTFAPLLLGMSADTFGIQSAFYLSAALALLAIIPVMLAIRKK